METKVLSKETRDKVSFISYIIPKFADEYKMSVQDAYFYLKQYGGWSFLIKHWWALHAENPFWAVRYLYDACYKNGGHK